MAQNNLSENITASPLSQTLDLNHIATTTQMMTPRHIHFNFMAILNAISGILNAVCGILKAVPVRVALLKDYLVFNG